MSSLGRSTDLRSAGEDFEELDAEESRQLAGSSDEVELVEDARDPVDAVQVMLDGAPAVQLR